MISVSSSGSFKKTTSFLENINSGKIFSNLDAYGSAGTESLRRATPRLTGETAGDWGHTLEFTPGKYIIYWYNSNDEYGANVAILIQYGHGTGTGGYVAGRDFINPAIRPVQDAAVDDVWRQVTNG